MKSYLNKAEKGQALTLAAFVGYLDERAEEWSKLGRSKDSIKSLRMAKSFALRAVDSLFEGLDQDEKAKVLNELRKMDVVCKYKDEAVREYERMKKLDSVTPVESEEFMDICGQALGVCQVCESKEPENCKLRKLFVKYDVEVFEFSPGPGECPYKIEKVTA